MFKLTSCNVKHTRMIAEQLAQYLQRGDVLLLSGDLGAGKSEFCRGLARGLGIEGPVPSPSFTILNVYQSDVMPFKHFDWYRIHTPEELFESGLDELIGGEGITAIEWHERAPELLPPDCLEVMLTPAPQEGERVITMMPHGVFRQLPWDTIFDKKGSET